MAHPDTTTLDTHIILGVQSVDFSPGVVVSFLSPRVIRAKTTVSPTEEASVVR